MTKDDESEALRYVNLSLAAAQLGREDYSLSLAQDGLQWSRQNGSLRGELMFLLMLGARSRAPLMHDERVRYNDELFTLLQSRLPHVLADADLRIVGAVLETILHEAGHDFRQKWSPWYEEVRGEFRDLPAITNLASALIVEDRLPSGFEKQVLRLDALLQLPLQAGDRRRVRGRLARLEKRLSAANVSAKTKRVIGSELRYREMVAGLKTGDIRLAISAASKLIQRPRRLERDEVLAGIIFLRLSHAAFSDRVLKSAEFHNTKAVRLIRKFILEHLENALNNSLLRHLATTLSAIEPLIGEYVDLICLRTRSIRQAISIISKLAGCFYSRSIALRAYLHAQQGGVDIFLGEYAALLQDAQRQGPLLTSEKPSIHSTLRSLTAIATGQHTSALPNDAASPGATGHSFSSVYQNLSLRPVEVEDTYLPPGIDSAQKELREDEVLFLLWLSPRIPYVVVTGRSMPPRLLALNVPASEVISFRDDFRRRRYDDLFVLEPPESFSWIWDALVGPALSLISFPGDAPPEMKKLIIVSPQVDLPFHLAYDTMRRRFLLEDVAVSYAHSLGSFLHSRRLSRAWDPQLMRCLLTGFAGGGNSGTLRLRGVARELDHLARSLPGKVLQAMPFSKFDDLSRLPKTWNVFHFSGHVRGAVGAERWWSLQYEDRSASTADLLRVLHDGVYLSTILGCSSLEQVPTSPGNVNGLAGALVAMGVPHVIGAMWRIQDDVAIEITSRTYEHWVVNRMPLSASLRAASLAVKGRWGPAVWGGVAYFGAD